MLAILGSYWHISHSLYVMMSRAPSEASSISFQIEMFDLFIVALRQMVHVWLCWRKDRRGLQSHVAAA